MLRTIRRTMLTGAGEGSRRTGVSFGHENAKLYTINGFQQPKTTTMRRISILITLALVTLPAIAEEKSVRKISVFLDSAIPHFAVGGPQWQTTFIFHNPSEELEKFYLSFFGDNGLPLAVHVLGGMHSSVLITLPPHATYKLVSDYRPEL